MNNWIDMASFTPISALLGGALIGLAAVILILGVGHILGMSGIASDAFNSLFTSSIKSYLTRWQVVFILGMAVATWGYSLLLGFPEFSINEPLWKTIVAGLLVGFGTRLGSGCTSGHGVCGISRLSPRSIVATLLFMSSGILTASLMAL